MNYQIGSLIKRNLPPRAAEALRPFWELNRTVQSFKAKRIFATAAESPRFLDIQQLATLQVKYPFMPEYGYDAHTLENRGAARAAQLLRLPGAQHAIDFLELGCWDGMVSCGLCLKGKKATAVDNRDAGFDERALREGVSLQQMNAADLRFEDESFDFVFSYDAFEHFGSPEDVLREAIRIVRKGGYIYLEFGPLYYSPLGEHAYRSITVPYCQFLFTRKIINEFTIQEGLHPVDFNHVNGWPVESYRDLWNKYSPVLKRTSYRETVDLSHLDLMKVFPSCFKSKSNCFDNFIVSNISVLFQKTS